jgi:hypothetical protein
MEAVMAAIDDIRETTTQLRVDVGRLTERIEGHEERDSERHEAVMGALGKLETRLNARSDEGRRPSLLSALPDVSTVVRLTALIGLGGSTLTAVLGGGWAAYQSATAALPPPPAIEVRDVPAEEPVAPVPVDGPQ